MFLNGFLFTCGSIWAFTVFLSILLLLLKSSKKKCKATAEVWREYLREIIKANEFKEAAFVTDLITGKKDTDEVDTPQGYKVHVDKFLVFEEDKDEASVLRVRKTFKIIKIKIDNAK